MGIIYGSGGNSFLKFNLVSNEKKVKKTRKSSQSRCGGKRKLLSARSKVLLKSLGYKLKKANK